ncbi:MAG: acetolactate synthase small subunit [Campylobacter sp.]|nr:acetolactate synthase small subunit [Campylobacter sp.]
MNSKRIISVVVLNEHGVLSRISGLFAGRGYNIDTLTVAPIPDSKFSRVSIITSGDERILEQIVKQLHKLIPVYKVTETGNFVEKEMVLLKIPLGENFSGLDAILKGYNGIVANSNETYIVVMACDDSDRIGNFLKAMAKFNPVEIVRGGSVVMDM